MTTDTADTLLAYADQLICSPARRPTPAAGLDAALAGLIDLVDLLHDTLQPVRPRSAYRERLRHRLLMAAQEQQTEPPLSPWRQHRVGLLIGAAALGSAMSVAGVIAYLLRNRANHRDAQAASG
jgi:hypothetical protein